MTEVSLIEYEHDLNLCCICVNMVKLKIRKRMTNREMLEKCKHCLLLISMEIEWHTQFWIWLFYPQICGYKRIHKCDLWKDKLLVCDCLILLFAIK